MKKTRILPLALLSGLAGLASAQSLGTANLFNAFIFNGATLNGSDAEGAVAVGADINGSSFNFAQQYTANVSSSYPSVGFVTGGAVNLSGGGSLNNGNGYVGSSFSGGGFNINGSGLYAGSTIAGVNNANGKTHSNSSSVSPVDFASSKSFLTSLSRSLATHGGSAVNMSDPNNWSIDAGNLNGTAYYSLSGSQLANNVTLNISNIASGTTLVFNVTGDVSSFGVTVNTNTGGYDKILWNFLNASVINVNNRALHGTILAPIAVVTQTQNIDGGLIAKSWNEQGAEIHFGIGKTFDGNVQAAPEPLTILGLAAGLAVLLVRKRN